jgi:hypothetical protein
VITGRFADEVEPSGVGPGVRAGEEKPVFVAAVTRTERMPGNARRWRWRA